MKITPKLVLKMKITNKDWEKDARVYKSDTYERRKDKKEKQIYCHKYHYSAMGK